MFARSCKRGITGTKSQLIGPQQLDGTPQKMSVKFFRNSVHDFADIQTERQIEIETWTGIHPSVEQLHENLAYIKISYCELGNRICELEKTRDLKPLPRTVLASDEYNLSDNSSLGLAHLSNNIRKFVQKICGSRTGVIRNSGSDIGPNCKQHLGGRVLGYHKVSVYL